MQYLILDTSALVKLYRIEDFRGELTKFITKQSNPLPLLFLHDLEMRNALRLMVFRENISHDEAETALANFKDDLGAGVFYRPDVDRFDIDLKAMELINQLSEALGCRILDVLHAAAVVMKATTFTGFDQRQLALWRRWISMS